MTGSRFRLLAGALTLLLGCLAPGLSRIVLSASVDSCLAAPDGGAGLAFRLRLLVPGELCPQGWSVPGPTATGALEFGIIITLSVLIGALLTLVSTLGAGLTLRSVIRSVRDWLRGRFNPAPAPACLIVETHRQLTPPDRVRLTRTPAVGPRRRGPPALCSA